MKVIKKRTKKLLFLGGDTQYSGLDDTFSAKFKSFLLLFFKKEDFLPLIAFLPTWAVTIFFDNSSRVVVPISAGEGFQLRDESRRIHSSLSIAWTKNGLNLQDWAFGGEMHRIILPGQQDIGENRTKPGVCIDDPLISLTLANWSQIRRRTNMQAPAGR